WNLVASIGSFGVAIGILMTLINAVRSVRGGTACGPDPWGGTPLEWFALSPPPPHNFDAIPDVRSTEPFGDIRRAIEERAFTPAANPRPVAGVEPGANPSPER